MQSDNVNQLLSRKNVAVLHSHLKNRNRWLHEGQWKVVRALFAEGKNTVQVQCGRKWGKTECAIYISTRFCLENPGALVIIVAPTRRQAKDIYWIHKRLQTYAPHSLIEEERDSELRLVFNLRNDDGIGSAIVIGGALDDEGLRGLNPDLVIYDEFRDHSKEFDVAMRPNLAAKNGKLLVISSPPDNECYYTEFMAEVQTGLIKYPEDYWYYEAPTSDNPTINRAWLKREEERLTDSGNRAVWEREYLGKYIQGGATAVLPVWFKRKKAIIKPHSIIKSLTLRDYKKIDWYSFSDPGQSTFAVLLVGYNKYTNQLFIIDEVYEQDREKTSAGQIWPRVESKKEAFNQNIDYWQNFYDPAASWFQVDVFDRFNAILIPAKKKGAKNLRDLNSPISRMKDFFDQKNAVFISDRCEMLVKELDKWSYTKDGKLPDVFDHTIDLLLYIFANIQISVRGEVDFDLEAALENGETVRLDTAKDIMRTHTANQDPFAFLGETTVLDEFEGDMDDGARRRYYFSGKRSDLFEEQGSYIGLGTQAHEGADESCSEISSGGEERD